MSDRHPPSLPPSGGHWRHLGQIITAHLVMLRDTDIVDDDALAALLTALDGVARGEPPSGSFSALVRVFDARLDALTPPGAVGAANVGRGTADVVAGLARMSLRDSILGLSEALDATRLALLDLAVPHAVTLMPAHSDGAIAVPTTFGHTLGGVIGPLGRQARHLQEAYADVNRSPLGAVALAATSIGIDRERTAELLGFDGLVANTFDAVTAVDHVVTAIDVAATGARTVRRFVNELLAWIRVEPSSMFLAEAWTGRDPALPQSIAPVGLLHLADAAGRIEGDATTVRRLAGDAAYGPATTFLDANSDFATSVVSHASDLLSRLHDLVAKGLDLNRAYLANRAGRGFSTSSDLADFLMIEEQLDPASARAIAGATISRAIEEGLEVSGITPEMIDAAALLVLGRELKVELESISRYLAPRRFIERRTATGAPSPAATRAYLDLERTRLAEDERWRLGASQRLLDAATNLERITTEALS